jgi:hypothetical protein
MPKKQNHNNSCKNLLWRIIDLYVDGFRNMTVGRSLWMIIIIKAFIMFAILKVFFFPDLLNSNFENDEDRAQHVRTQLINDNN